jgi:hypothetical protein
VLDGFGTFTAPPPTARPVLSNFAGRANADHPPGFYGPPESFLAINTLAPSDRLAPLDFAPLGNTKYETYRTSAPLDLRGPILLLALLAAMLDTLIVLVLGGGVQRLLARRSRGATAIVAGFIVLAFGLAHACAQTPEQSQVPPAALQTRLAYVITGDSSVDAVSKAGLAGLSVVLAQRTALEPGGPIGLHIARDPLAFYPLIYWPIAPGMPLPSSEALKRIDAYMKNGGTVLFDTRDAINALPGLDGQSTSPAKLELRKILSSLDVPPLEPVPSDHVLTKTFYILRNFPGRFSNGRLWVEALPRGSVCQREKRPACGGDGVSPILITSNDLAGAWAMDRDGEFMLPIVQGEPDQREMAFRAGINIVMYTLTGNYKADQVHVPALLERLGQ